MGILAQCGYQRGEKVSEGLATRVIEGAILSPRDEKPASLEAAAGELRRAHPGATLLLDPQFYAATMSDPRDGHLGEFGYYANHCGLTSRTAFAATKLQKYVEACLDYQLEPWGTALSKLVSPTIIIEDFRDHWSQVALDLAVAAADHAKAKGSRPLLVSLVVSENAFRTTEAVEEYLDALTELDVAGFYVIVKRNMPSAQSALDSHVFARVMYFCYVLGAVNEYEVIAGYTDWCSFMLASVGVAAAATGWYQNLRQFTLARFLPAPAGGRRPKKRYPSTPLLASVLLNPVLEDLHQAQLLDLVLSGAARDHLLASGPAAADLQWSDQVSCLAHWEALAALWAKVATPSAVAERLTVCAQLIAGAESLGRRLLGQGFGLEPSVEGSLSEWKSALQEFRALAHV